MKLEQLKKIIKQGESDSVEFKKSTGLLAAAFKTVCAFLNGKGGIVLIGVTDQGKIVGQDVSDKTKKEIAQEISNIEPPAQSCISVDYVSVDNKKQVIVIKVIAGGHIPYIWDGRPFHRIQSTSQKMSQHRYEQLIIERGQLNHSWEDVIARNYSVEDLDDQLIKKIVKMAIQKGRLSDDVSTSNTAELLTKFKLLSNEGLTRAAVVLFCKDSNKQFTQSRLKLARFKGTDKNEFIDNKQYVGNIFYLYEQAIMFLGNYLPIEGKIVEGKPDRVDIPAIPHTVLREAIINALCHRNYDEHGGSMSIAIYDDRVEITNTGTLPYGMKVEDLAVSHSSVPRNPKIAEVLYAAGYIEMWGRGTQNIINISVVAKNPRPIFIATNVDFTVRLPLRTPILSGAQTLTTRQSDILKILMHHHNPIKASEITSLFDGAVNVRTIQRELLILQRQGLVTSLGQGRSTVWKIATIATNRDNRDKS